MDLSRMHKPLEKEIADEVAKVISKGDFILGGKVEEFENNFAKYCEVNYAAGVSTGTDALELILRAYDIGECDEVILPANTFIATASAVSSAGAKPVLADVSKYDYNLDINEIKKAINKKTKAIIPVHLYGYPANMEEITEIAKKYNLRVIEDACQAHGAKYNGKRAGNLGDAAAFSFYPAKNLGAFGDGGIVVSNEKELIDRIKMLRNYGQSKKYYHDMFAFNMRLDTIQAAVLNTKLQHLDEWNNLRRKSARRLNELLRGKVLVPEEIPNIEQVYHLYVVRAKDEEERNKLAKFLNEKEIATGLHYPIPIHLQKAYSHLGYKEGNFPISEELCRTGLSLPMFPYMKDEEINYLADCVKEFYKNGK